MDDVKYKKVDIYFNNSRGLGIYSVKEIRFFDDYIEIIEFVDEEDEKLGIETITRVPRKVIKNINFIYGG